MVLSAVAKGKKRALVDDSVSEPRVRGLEGPVKRSKSRAETKDCPICKEKIPLRLLGRHADLEAERIDYIIRQIGSDEPIRDEFDDDPTRSRRSAMKAFKSIAPRTVKADTTDATVKTLQLIKRRRKQRHAKLRDMIKDDDDDQTRGNRNGWTKGLVGGRIDCPICSQTIRGDQGVLEAHVDSCVANEELRTAEQAQHEALQRQYEEEARWESTSNGHYVGDLRGAGFHTRDLQTLDVDDEIDIDGDDAAFGAPQFTEGDVLRSEREEGVDDSIDIENGDSESEAALQVQETASRGSTGASIPHTSEEPHNKPARLEVASMAMRKHADRARLLSSLNIVTPRESSSADISSTSPVCRICLDPYEDPTVSTGCWHTCCKACWLRCLGSTKLCPIYILLLCRLGSPRTARLRPKPDALEPSQKLTFKAVLPSKRTVS